MDARAVLESLDIIAEAPGGVDRLRELLVGLAVTGRLTLTEGKSIEPGIRNPARASDRTAIAPAYQAALDCLPPHWSVLDVGQILDHQIGKMLNKKTMSGLERRYLRSVNVQNGFIDVQDIKSMMLEPDEWEKYSVEDGDIFVVEVNMGEWCFATDGKRLLPRSAAPIACPDGMSPGYFQLVFGSQGQPVRWQPEHQA